MKAAVLYLRARHFGVAVPVVVIIGLGLYGLAALMVQSGAFGDQALIPTVVIGPIALAIVVASTVDDASDEIVRASPFRFGIARLGHIFGLALISALVLVPLGTFSNMALSSPAAIRNLAGYTGLALVTAWFATGRWAWVPPVIYGAGALTVEGAARSGHLFFWPTRPDASASAWWVAAMLFSLGLIACVVRRPFGLERGVGDEVPSA